MASVLHFISVFVLSHIICSHFAITLDSRKVRLITSLWQRTEIPSNGRASFFSAWYHASLFGDSGEWLDLTCGPGVWALRSKFLFQLKTEKLGENSRAHGCGSGLYASLPLWCSLAWFVAYLWFSPIGDIGFADTLLNHSSELSARKFLP
jgi:hypothetical protein